MALSTAQLDAAIRYNRARTYDLELLRRIQRTVQAEDDGILGRQSVQAIATWQAAHGLTADGKVGPGTLAAFEQEWGGLGLTPAQVQSAIALAQGLGYAGALVERIQGTVGAAVTGRVDEDTVLAIARWQAGHGLVADGRLGPNTMRAFERSWQAPSPGRCVYSIHPGIGIARVGDSAEAFFIGPEAPGIVTPSGEHRDGLGFIKRQGARFRVYEQAYDAAGRLQSTRELTASEATIEWTAHLVNRKAAAPKFPPGSEGRRNQGIEEESLVIDAGRRSVSGRNRLEPAVGAFLGSSVRLGDIRTDGEGRLVVLGGFGTSRSPTGRAIDEYANNDGWHDDTSDGPVTARVTFGSGQSFEATPAWVVVAPPSYAPEIHNVVTWYDHAFHIAAQLDPRILPAKVSFTRDIWPILERTVLLQWVSGIARQAHGRGAEQDFTLPARLAKLSSNSPEHGKLRHTVYDALRRPDGGRNMPALNAGLDPADPRRKIGTMLTPTQLEQMEAWAMGLFEADWPGSAPAPRPLASIPVEEQPAALDRAAIEPCSGGPFFPGIEAGFDLARLDTYEAPFRIDRRRPPGSITAHLAVPWQADFQACQQRWWPSERPGRVQRAGSDVSFDWTEGIDMNEMVEQWADLGFVRRDGDRYLERERRSR